jgi:predicted choloylglycine hydrolase
MDILELNGSYEEMGIRQGLSLKRAGVKLPSPSPKMLRFARNCEEITAQYAPELLEELRALSETAELDYESLLTVTLTAPYDPAQVPSAACTVLAALPSRTTDGRTVVGRNYDFFHDISEEGATTYITRPKDRYASLGNCDIWVGREDGVNEAGLFVGQAAFFRRGIKPGMVFWFIVRMALDRCATVEEGLELIKGLPHAASWTYLLADAKGDAAVVEPTPEKVAVRYAQDGLLLLTNHAVCPECAGTEAFTPPDSRPRYNRLKELLGGSHKVDMEMVKAALRDHEGLVCSHGAHFPRRKFGTLWSVVGRPGERHLEIASGHPCENEYELTAF